MLECTSTMQVSGLLSVSMRVRLFKGQPSLGCQASAAVHDKICARRPLMEAHAHAICSSGGDILNVGFGMGLVDEVRARSCHIAPCA